MIRALASWSVLAVFACSLSAQSADAPKAFVIADVHPSAYTAFPFMHGDSVQGDRYFLKQATMVDLIATAYGVDNANVQGGPSWLERDRYDVQGKVPLKTTKAQVRPMLQTLLADRFALVVKNGSVPMPAYSLTVAGAKPKMAEAEGTGDAACLPLPPPKDAAPNAPWNFKLKCSNMTMEAFAKTLQQFNTGYLPESVVDNTDLKGAYDFVFEFTAKQQLDKMGSNGISMFDAVTKELGLKLELKTAPRPVLLVESVNEMPTANPAGLAEAMPEPPSPTFEVVVIKPSKPDEKGFGRITGNGVEARGMPLKFLVQFAWDLNPNNNEALVNEPKWLETVKFDVDAKAGANVRMDASPQGPLINYEDLRMMIRAMLAERFEMKTHMEDRPITAYTLIAANPKLKPTADPKQRTKCKEGPGPDGKDPRIASPVLNRLLTCQNMTMPQISDELQRVANGYIYGPVTDGTGLKGGYDFTLSFSSADKVSTAVGADASSSDPNGALSVFDAVNRQLGLKLEKGKKASPVLVIDHMDENPTEN